MGAILSSPKKEIFPIKLYSNRETAPLKFHKLFWFVLLPIDFLRDLQQFLSLITNADKLYFSTTIAILRGAIILPISILCFVGFFRWKKYAWYGVYFYWGLVILYDLIFFLYTSTFYPEDAMLWGKDLFYDFIITTPIFLYYYKRRPLFFTDQDHV